jgi:hypothetical protein
VRSPRRVETCASRGRRVEPGRREALGDQPVSPPRLPRVVHLQRQRRVGGHGDPERLLTLGQKRDRHRGPDLDPRDVLSQAHGDHGLAGPVEQHAVGVQRLDPLPALGLRLAGAGGAGREARERTGQAKDRQAAQGAERSAGGGQGRQITVQGFGARSTVRPP